MSYIERIRSQGRDANPFFRLMGIDIASLEKGKATLSMRVRDDMLNGEGYLQGGMFTALADEAMVLSIYSLLEEDQVIATISESTSFMRGAGPGMVIVAEGRIIKKGRRVVFSEADVRLEGQHDVIARSSASFAISTTGKKPAPDTR
ncbi:MAG: PaaI family thioesterase [Methanomicrobiales archaeon]